MTDIKSLRYAAKLHCQKCGGDEPIVAEEAWWVGNDLHLLHDDGTEIVIEDAHKRGYTRENTGGPSDDL